MEMGVIMSQWCMPPSYGHFDRDNADEPVY